ncbi:MAG: hypothetical protein AB8F95_04450 [Bacteroidia bacterium]
MRLYYRYYVLLIGLFAGFPLFGQPEASFEFRNTRTSNGVYSFDVFMKASQGGTFHSRGQIYFFYNQAAFGNTVVANGRVNHQQLFLLNEPDPFGGTKYQTVNITDNGSRIAVTWQMVYSGIPATSLTHTILPDTFTPLYHFEITMANPNIQPGIFFDISLMGAQQFYVMPNGTVETQYTMTLPVSWDYVQAEKMLNRNVELKWATTQETNNDYFEIEKALGNGQFQKIGQIDGSGTNPTGNSYSFLDQSAMASRNAYRIKQIDLDGQFSYSEVVEVSFEYLGQDKFKVFPIPLQETLTLLAEAREEVPYTYRLTDLYGKEILRGTLDAFSSKADIPVGNLPRGNYILLVENPYKKQLTFRLSK